MLKFNVGDKVKGLPFNEPEVNMIARWRRRMSEVYGTVKTVDPEPDNIYQYFVNFDNGCDFWCREEWIELANPATLKVTSDDLMTLLE